jgi:hypothetical protein
LLAKAFVFVRARIAYSASAFAQLALWQVPKPVAGSRHGFKYRLVYVVGGVCVLRDDNEGGTGDHRHVEGKESRCVFTTPDQLITDFQRDIARWNRGNRSDSGLIEEGAVFSTPHEGEEDTMNYFLETGTKLTRV